MRRRIPARFMQHRVLLEAYEGITADGDTFAAPRMVRAYVEDTRRTVPVGAGTEALSSTSVWVDPEDDLPVGSMCTVWLGLPRQRRAKVLSSAFFDDRDMPSHVRLYLE